jgi:hypothetical protein
MTVWMRLFSSSTLLWTAIEKSGSSSWSLGRWVEFRSPAWAETSSRVPITFSW